MYVFVRRDIPIQHQMVQASHAALECGLEFPYIPAEPSSLIVLGVSNKKDLLKARKYLNINKIRNTMFFEPSWDHGYTAIGTEAITEDKRHLLKRFQLWKP